MGVYTCFIFMLFIKSCFMSNKDHHIGQDHDNILNGVVKISLDTSRVTNEVNVRFLSITLPQNIFNRTRDIRKHFLFRSKKVQTLAKGLLPCYVRVGGNSADFLIFSPEDDSQTNQATDYSAQWAEADTTLRFQPQETSDDDDDFRRKKNLKNFTFPAKYYDELNSFVHTVGWDMIFSLNAFLRNSRGDWDTSNAELLLNYTAGKKYKIAGWELGNEPNDFKAYGKDITPAQLAIDYDVMRYQALKKYNLPGSADFQIIGPSVTQLSRKSARKFFTEFLQKGGSYVVTAPTFHQYYVNVRNVSEQDFMDPQILDSLAAEIQTGNDISYTYGSNMRLWLGETGSCSGGGAEGLSDRYIAGFMWLDKLGLSASLGIDVVVRQTFYGGKYGLIDYDTSDPNPDYWLSLLYKTLVGIKVLKTLNSDKTRHIRTYAHCTSTKIYAAGSVTLFVMNMMNQTVGITSSLFGADDVHVYLMEPGDDAGLNSQKVKLNNKVLQMVSDSELPDLTQYLRMVKGTVSWPANTYGFIVIPSAKAKACL